MSLSIHQPGLGLNRREILFYFFLSSLLLSCRAKYW